VFAVLVYAAFATSKFEKKESCLSICASTNANFIEGSPLNNGPNIAHEWCMRQCTCVKRRGFDEFDTCSRQSCSATCNLWNDNIVFGSFEDSYLTIAKSPESLRFCKQACNCVAAAPDQRIDIYSGECSSDICREFYFDHYEECSATLYTALKLQGVSSAMDLGFAGWVAYCGLTEDPQFCPGPNDNRVAHLVETSCKQNLVEMMALWEVRTFDQDTQDLLIGACECEAHTSKFGVIQQRIVNRNVALCAAKTCRAKRAKSPTFSLSQGDCEHSFCTLRCQYAFNFEETDEFNSCVGTCKCQAEGKPVRDCIRNSCSAMCNGARSKYGYQIQSLHSNVCEDLCYCTEYDHQGGAGKSDGCVIAACEHARYADKKLQCIQSACSTNCQGKGLNKSTPAYGRCFTDCKCKNSPNGSLCPIAPLP